jgi:hypothetical protein
VSRRIPSAPTRLAPVCSPPAEGDLDPRPAVRVFGPEVLAFPIVGISREATNEKYGLEFVHADFNLIRLLSRREQDMKLAAVRRKVGGMALHDPAISEARDDAVPVCHRLQRHPSSPRHELVVCAFGDVIPGAWNSVNEACTFRDIAVLSARSEPLLYDFIRPRQHRGRDRQAEGLVGLQVDDELELGRLSMGRSPGLAPLRILST